MIKQIIFSLLFVILLTNVHSQENFTKEKIKNSAIVNLNSNQLWKNLIGFGNLEVYVPTVIDTTIVEGKGIGAVRTIILLDKSKIIEKLTHLHSKKMKFKYKMIETPMPIRNYKSEIIIKRIDENTSLAIFTSTYNVAKQKRAYMYKTINNFQRTLLFNLAK